MKIASLHRAVATTWLALSIFVSSGEGLAEPQVHSSSQSASSSSASPKKKCCFCIAPNEGRDNAAEFKEYCNSCLMDPKLNPKVASCDTFETVAAKDFKGADPQKCSSDVLVYNLEHGPIPGRVFNRIDVCVKSMPSCALEFLDLSCRTFEDPKSVDEYLAKLQKSMGPDSTVTLCGNATSNFPKGKCAAFESARVTYVVTSNEIKSPPSRCAKSFTTCDREGYTHTCLTGQKELKEQVCCARMIKDPRDGSEYGASNGLWGEPGGGCAAFPSCPPACSTKKYCSPGKEKLFIQECVKIRGGDYACQIDSDDCKTFGRVCNPKELLCDDPPKNPSSPSSSGSSSARNVVSSSQSETGRAVGRFVEVSRMNQEYEASPAWLSTATSFKNLFGSSIVIEVSGSLADAGILLHTVDPGSTLGALRFTNGDVIHFVNDTPIRSRGDLARHLSPSLKYLGITYSRGANRRLVTLRVGARELGASK